MTAQRATYRREDGKAGVSGLWHHRGGCLWLGEVTVSTATSIMRFSSTTPMSGASLAGYATDEYLARHASKFMARS
jgi:hypothetical protein